MEDRGARDFHTAMQALIGFPEADELFAYVEQHPVVGENTFLLDGIDLALRYAKRGEITEAIVISGKLLLVSNHVNSSLESLITLVMGHSYSLAPQWHPSAMELLMRLIDTAEEEKEIEIGRQSYLILAKIYQAASNHDQTEIAFIESLAFLAEEQDIPAKVFTPEELQKHLILLSLYEEGEYFLENAMQLSKEMSPLSTEQDQEAKSAQTEMLQQGYAVSMMEASFAYYQESIQTIGKARALCGLGNLYLELSRFQEAEELFLAGISFCEAKGHTQGAADVYLGLGRLLQKQSRSDDARTMFQKSVELYEKIDNQSDKDQALQELKEL